MSSCLNLLGDGDHAHNAMNGMGHDAPLEVENTMLLAFEAVAWIWCAFVYIILTWIEGRGHLGFVGQKPTKKMELATWGLWLCSC